MVIKAGQFLEKVIKGGSGARYKKVLTEVVSGWDNIYPNVRKRVSVSKAIYYSMNF